MQMIPDLSRSFELPEKQIGEHESKFVLPNYRADILAGWLEKHCEPDPDHPLGKVSSIYYDTRQWGHLNEKLNSDYLKSKVRLRWYSDPITSQIYQHYFLEAKFKTGSSRSKDRLRLIFDDDWVAFSPLSDSRFMNIPGEFAKEGIIFRDRLYPTFQISYIRLRFLDLISGARLCVDKDIHVPRINQRMVRHNNTTYLPNAVFELKCKSDILPNWLHQITALGCRKYAFSKYGQCYAHLNRLIY